MDKVPITTLAHAGLEIVVIAGVTFWFNKRISSLQEEVNLMKDTISKYEEIIGQQQQILSVPDIYSANLVKL